MEPTLSFSEGVKRASSRIFEFNGRSRRSEYWWFYLLIVLIELPIAFILRINCTQEAWDLLSSILQVVFWIPVLGVSVRRLHDAGRSGWWLLLALTGIGNIVLLVWFCMDSNPTENEYGPNPKLSEPSEGASTSSPSDSAKPKDDFTSYDS